MKEVKETLVRIYDAVNWIKTDENSSIYSSCENVSLVRQTLINLNKLKHPISKMQFNLEDLPSFSGYSYTEDMLSATERTKLVLRALKEANIKVGFNFSDLEKFIANVIFFNLIYINGKLYGDPDEKLVMTPFFNYEVLSTSPVFIEKEKYDLFFKIFSQDYNKLDLNGTFKLIRHDNQYVTIYYQQFICNISNFLEDYFIGNASKQEKEKYFKVRGKLFEKVVFDAFKLRFQNIQQLSNIVYYNEKGKFELDQLIIFDNNILIIDDKSSSFDNSYTFIGKEEEKLKNLKRSFGKGFISLSRAYENFISKKEISIKDKNNFVKLNLEGKNIFTLIIALNETKSITGSLSKICKEENLSHLPILLSFSTLYEILANVEDFHQFIFYVSERDELINKNKNISFDVDEIDAYGMIVGQDYAELKKRMAYIGDLDLNFMVGNSVFRKKCNYDMNEYFINELLIKYFNLST